MVTFEIIEGNPGALTFLIDAYDKNPFIAEFCFEKMQKAGVTGSRLYMLWNDCCGRNTEKTMDVIINKTSTEIIRHIDGGDGRGIPF